MPELPKVETIIQQLKRSDILDHKVQSIEVFWPKSFVGQHQKLVNVAITSLERHGKYFLFGLSNGQTLAVHLGMSGCFRFEPTDHTRISITFINGIELYYSDPRKFGRFTLVDCSSEITKRLGPDALEISQEELQKCLQSNNRLKPLLLDQACIAGLGNIYVDEALWEAEIHPTCSAKQLSTKQVQALHAAIKKTLQDGIKHGLTNIEKDDALYGKPEKFRHLYRVYGRAGKPCPRCHAPLQRLLLVGRTTVICPNCQA